jgi:hypothetical protein
MLAEGAVGVSGVTLDKYGGRVVADASTRSIANVSSALLAKGYARFYGGGRRRGWCDDQATPVCETAPRAPTIASSPATFRNSLLAVRFGSYHRNMIRICGNYAVTKPIRFRASRLCHNLRLV